MLEAEARRLNEAFEHHVATGLPFVVMKSAASLDGKTAAVDGTSRWITSEDARVGRAAAARVVRRRSSSARAPSPRTIPPSPSAIHGSPARAPPLRVAVDSAGRLPPVGRLFDGSAPTLIATTDRTDELRVAEWQTAGAEVVVLDRDADDGVSLRGLLELLGEREVQGVLVEAGANLAWALLRDGLVDRIVLYLAPKLLGGAAAPGVVDGRGFAPVGEALPLDVRARRADRTRSEGGGACSPGSLRSVGSRATRRCRRTRGRLRHDRRRQRASAHRWR